MSNRRLRARAVLVCVPVGKMGMVGAFGSLSADFFAMKIVLRRVVACDCARPLDPNVSVVRPADRLQSPEKSPCALRAPPGNTSTDFNRAGEERSPSFVLQARGRSERVFVHRRTLQVLEERCLLVSSVNTLYNPSCRGAYASITP